MNTVIFDEDNEDDHFSQLVEFTSELYELAKRRSIIFESGSVAVTAPGWHGKLFASGGRLALDMYRDGGSAVGDDNEELPPEATKPGDIVQPHSADSPPLRRCSLCGADERLVHKLAGPVWLPTCTCEEDALEAEVDAWLKRRFSKGKRGVAGDQDSPAAD